MNDQDICFVCGTAVDHNEAHWCHEPECPRKKDPSLTCTCNLLAHEGCCPDCSDSPLPARTYVKQGGGHVREIITEANFKVGDRVQLAQATRWPGIGKELRRKDHDLVPAGATGRLQKHDGMWIIHFDKYRAADGWPCLVGSYPAQLPPWIVKAGSCVAPPLPMTEAKPDRYLGGTHQTLTKH
jgi:hypothetical protein